MVVLKKFNIGRNVFFAGVVSLLMDVSSEMVYPLVPLFLTNVLGVSMITVGLIEGIAEATASLLKIFSGWLSDKLGKRKLLMGLGYGISALSRPLIAGASVWPEVLGARFIDRVGKGVRTAPRDALIADSVQRPQLGKAFGFHRMMDTVGAAIGPGIAFVVLALSMNNLRLVFYLSTIPAAGAVLVIIFFIKEKGRHVNGAKPLPGLSLFTFDHEFRHYIIVIGIFSLATFSDAFLILQARNLGVRNALIPLVYLLYNLVYALTSMPMGVIGDRIGLKKMVFAGFLYYAVVYAGVGLSTGAVHMWILFPLYGVYKGMSEGAQRAYLAEVAPREMKATAFGVYHMVSGVMLLPASLIAGVLWDRFGPMETFFYGSAVALLASVYFILGNRKQASEGAVGKPV